MFAQQAIFVNTPRFFLTTTGVFQSIKNVFPWEKGGRDVVVAYSSPAADGLGSILALTAAVVFNQELHYGQAHLPPLSSLPLMKSLTIIFKRNIDC